MVVGPRSQRLATVGSGPDALSIGDLYRRIDRALARAIPGEVWVSGEVRSFNVSSSGHCYLELVDPAVAHDNSTPVLKVVCWSSRWRIVRAELNNLGISLDAGLVVRVRGKVQLYKPRGDISFILSDLDTDALLGKVAAARARLVKALVDEGLFERNRRLPVPVVPLRIGLVASPSTEGQRDFLGQLENSGMAFAVRTKRTQVQGREAPGSIAAAIKRLQSSECDLIVVVRGGGSKADLGAFDHEKVARAIATCRVPVWTGIGHTGDLSVADEVANRSFITPTECGQELARIVTDFWRSELEAALVVGRAARERLERAERLLSRQRRAVASGSRGQLERHGERLAHLARTLRGEARGQLDTHGHHLLAKAETVARCARRAVQTEEQSLSARSARLATLPGRRLETAEQRTAQWRRLFAAYDYHRQLERGYSVTRDRDGSVVRSVSSVRPGSRLLTQLTDGAIDSEVTDVRSDEGLSMLDDKGVS
ncbi:MAG: exodeoxyribonuclease VII large subunit [Acidimicrobiales bacterium]